MAGKKAPASASMQPQIRASCSWEACPNRADVCEEIEPGKGRHNLCELHYVLAHRMAAKRRCEAKGLHSVEQMKEFCRRRLSAGLFKPMPQEREPGCDDEPMSVAEQA